MTTPVVAAWGASETVQVPAPSPASAAVSSSDERCTPVETSIRAKESDWGSVKSLGSFAFRTSASPAPSSRTDASCVRAVSPHAGPAVDISADFTCHEVQAGCCCRSSAAAPATCGVAIDVPAKTENVDPVVSGGVDESTSRPGAERSGFRRCPKSVGPADEKLVTTPLRFVGSSRTSVDTRIFTWPPLASANARSARPSRSAIIPAGTGSGIGIGFASPGRLSTRTIPAASPSSARAAFEAKLQRPRETRAILPASEPFGRLPSPLSGSAAVPQRYGSAGLPSVPTIVATSTIVWSAFAQVWGTLAIWIGTAPSDAGPPTTLRAGAKTCAFETAATEIASGAVPGEPVEPRP